jgi:hypothetical protein
LIISIRLSSSSDRHQIISIEPRKLRIGIGDPVNVHSPEKVSVGIGAGWEGLKTHHLEVEPMWKQYTLFYSLSERDFESVSFHIDGIETETGPLSFPKIKLPPEPGWIIGAQRIHSFSMRLRSVPSGRRYRSTSQVDLTGISSPQDQPGLCAAVRGLRHASGAAPAKSVTQVEGLPEDPTSSVS